VDFLGEIADFDDGAGAKEAAFSAWFAKVKVDPRPRLPGRSRRPPKESPLLAFPLRPAANAVSKAVIRFSQGVRRSPPAGGMHEFPPHRFQIFHSPGQRWHRPRCGWQASESSAFNSPSKNACRTSSQSVQAPAELVLDSGEGGRIMAMRIARGNNLPTSSVKSSSGWLCRWS